jgi:hypothetical protein
LHRLGEEARRLLFLVVQESTTSSFTDRAVEEDDPGNRGCQRHDLSLPLADPLADADN